MLLDPSISRSPVLFSGEDLPILVYQRAFNVHQKMYAMESISEILQYGGTQLAKSLIQTSILTSSVTQLAKIYHSQYSSGT